MLNKKVIAPILGLAVTAGLVGCEGNNSTTQVAGITLIDLKEVDKSIVAEAWTVGNYKSIATLGYSALIDNLNVRSALLGLEQNLGALLNLFSTSGTFSCDAGNMVVSQDNAHTRVKYNACQNGGVRFDGEVWTNLTAACDDSTVTETFTMGYNDYRQRQKLGDNDSYSQMYANGEYQFISRSQLDAENVSDNNLCPKLAGIDSEVVLTPEAFIQIEEDESETTITNSSYELQPDTAYIEYENLTLTESTANSLVYSISATLNMNTLGNDIVMTGSDFNYALNGKVTAGTLSFVNGDSEIIMTFASDSVTVVLDLDTNVAGTDASETFEQSEL